MIRTIGNIRYRAGTTYGNHWRYSASVIEVACDHPGCDVRREPSGLEHNGPTIECIYGMDGWLLAQQDLCPKHSAHLCHSCKGKAQAQEAHSCPYDDVGTCTCCEGCTKDCAREASWSKPGVTLCSMG